MINRVESVILKNNLFIRYDQVDNHDWAIEIWTIDDMNLQVESNEIRNYGKAIVIYNTIKQNFGAIKNNNFIDNSFEDISYEIYIKNLKYNVGKNLFMENYWSKKYFSSCPKFISGSLILSSIHMIKIPWFILDTTPFDSPN